MDPVPHSYKSTVVDWFFLLHLFFFVGQSRLLVCITILVCTLLVCIYIDNILLSCIVGPHPSLVVCSRAPYIIDRSWSVAAAAVESCVILVSGSSGGERAVAAATTERSRAHAAARTMTTAAVARERKFPSASFSVLTERPTHYDGCDENDGDNNGYGNGRYRAISAD